MGTKDLDFGVYISNDIEYNQLRTMLKKEFDYVESSENPFRLLTEDGKQVDFLSVKLKKMAKLL